MEKDYYETLINVLSFLSSEPKPTTRKLRGIAGERWHSIREYLKKNEIVVFASLDSIFDVRKSKVGAHLDNARMELERIEKAEADRGLDRISKRTSIVISILAFIVSLISLYFSLR